ncbi:single-stranded DNA-binding protein [Nonomuraea dietziae]|uniref:single-stranded DNA-binding protein n=1 Tax=Nonomuraea dietziae TaxID=65515 RepID=UPI00340F2BD3
MVPRQAQPPRAAPFQEEDHHVDRNDVTLVGRLSASPDERAMPSGDTLTKWRIIVRRRPLVRRGGFVDTIQCVTFDAEVAAMVKAMRPRDPMEIRGALRCRIYGPPSAKSWRYEVEVHAVALVAMQPSADPPATTETLTAETDRPAAPVLLMGSTPKPRTAAEITSEPLSVADVAREPRAASDGDSEPGPTPDVALALRPRVDVAPALRSLVDGTLEPRPGADVASEPRAASDAATELCSASDAAPAPGPTADFAPALRPRADVAPALRPRADVAPASRSSVGVVSEPFLGADATPELCSSAAVAPEHHRAAEAGRCDVVLGVAPTGAPEPHSTVTSATHPTADHLAKAHLTKPRLPVPYPPQARGKGTQPEADHTPPTSVAASVLNPGVPTTGPTIEAGSAQSATTADPQVSTDGASPVTLPVVTAQAAGPKARRATPTAGASPRAHHQDTAPPDNPAEAPSDLAGTPPRPVAYLASTG